jgi:hypothetical protein
MIIFNLPYQVLEKESHDAEYQKLYDHGNGGPDKHVQEADAVTYCALQRQNEADQRASEADCRGDTALPDEFELVVRGYPAVALAEYHDKAKGGGEVSAKIKQSRERIE